jgi:methylmalonyl-CoA mutase N-terminal domain/subunit
MIIAKMKRIKSKYQNKQIEKLKRLKATRDNQYVQICLEKITAVAKTKENILPHIYEAVKAYASVGEIIDAMKKVFGVYQEDSIF